MEVVALHELGAAEAQHVVVHATGPQPRAEAIGALFGLRERARLRDAVQAAVVFDLQAFEGEQLVHLAAQRVVGLALAREALGRERRVQERGHAAAVTVAALARGERRVDALPLRRALSQAILEASLLEQPRERRARVVLAEQARETLDGREVKRGRDGHARSLPAAPDTPPGGTGFPAERSGLQRGRAHIAKPRSGIGSL